jgi:hypothetical protein
MALKFVSTAARSLHSSSLYELRLERPAFCATQPIPTGQHSGASDSLGTSGAEACHAIASGLVCRFKQVSMGGWARNMQATCVAQPRMGFRFPDHTCAHSQRGIIKLCSLIIQARVLPRNICLGSSFGTPAAHITVVNCFCLFSWYPIAGRVCDHDIEVSDHRRVLVVSSTKLCGPGDEISVGAGGGHSHDSTGYFVHIVSIL